MRTVSFKWKTRLKYMDNSLKQPATFTRTHRFIAQAQSHFIQNGTLFFTTAISAFFSFLLYSQLPWQNAFKTLQCSIRILFNALHLPTNHKTIKTPHTPYKQSHYAEEKIPSVLHQYQLTFSPLGTSLPPLWVSAFTGKLCLTSHAL